MQVQCDLVHKNIKKKILNIKRFHDFFYKKTVDILQINR